MAELKGNSGLAFNRGLFGALEKFELGLHLESLRVFLRIHRLILIYLQDI
jgi:hypothetical protein